MTRLDETKRRIAQVMVCFGKEYMALQPESVLVDVHESHVIVTLCRATSAAERACADNAGNRALLEKLSCAAFDAVKSGLETEVAAIMKRPIQRSRINVDPLAGDAVVSFIFGESGI